jgi:dynein heavy chain
MWCADAETALQSDKNRVEQMKIFYQQNVTQLTELTELVRGKLSSIVRKSIVALVTQDVHNRDIVEAMCVKRVQAIMDFTWQQQLRYYWGAESAEDDLVYKQVDAMGLYGYEYMGAASRLVITPLTDRCWMTITGALHIKLGAAPAGPAGTGKTESTKDLAKAIARQCVVFNCSDQIDYKMMGKLFSGVVAAGAWTCLDEFNRILIEVLSVVAQQLLSIRTARLEGKNQFSFEGHTLLLKSTMGVFITMNPGYAGRTELPDNLKVQFRPVAMMVPDYTLIAEIMLYAEGFGTAKKLSGKFTKLYRLSSEQLSKQDHYDFGMRAVKSVLVMAGSLKRSDPDLDEDILLIRAMRDSNVPKFLADDLPLFAAIVSDMFPGVEVPFVDYGSLQAAIEHCYKASGLQIVESSTVKTIQLFETFNVRFGVMTVGFTMGGKTCLYRMLAKALTKLRADGNPDEKFQTVRFDLLNPKCISMGELYGEFNELTQEWTDGLASTLMRNFVADETMDYKSFELAHQK